MNLTFRTDRIVAACDVLGVSRSDFVRGFCVSTGQRSQTVANLARSWWAHERELQDRKWREVQEYLLEISRGHANEVAAAVILDDTESISKIFPYVRFGVDTDKINISERLRLLFEIIWEQVPGRKMIISQFYNNDHFSNRRNLERIAGHYHLYRLHSEESGLVRDHVEVYEPEGPTCRGIYNMYVSGRNRITMEFESYFSNMYVFNVGNYYDQFNRSTDLIYFNASVSVHDKNEFPGILCCLTDNRVSAMATKVVLVKRTKRAIDGKRTPVNIRSKEDPDYQKYYYRLFKATNSDENRRVFRFDIDSLNRFDNDWRV